MSYRDLKIEHSYISRGDNNIADSFLNPVLKCTKEYKRSVGFFSSGVLETITDGALSLARNGGSIKLIASPKLSEEDVEAINLGYEQKNQKLSDAFTRDFVREVEKLNDMRLQLLCDLIRKGVLDIKIAITEDTGIYHDKLGVMKDFDGNILVFYGSSNSSYAGYRSNYENAAAVSLERTFSNGQMEQTALPSDLKAQEAVRVLTAAQVEADLAPSSVSSVTYRVVFQTNSEADYCS